MRWPTATRRSPMPNGAASGRAPRWPRASGWRSMPATASTMPAPKRSRRCRRSSSSTSGTSWSARRCSSGSRRDQDHARAPWSAAAPGPRQMTMILGIGSDITDVRRIAKVIERHGDRFLDRIFTPTERARAERQKEPRRDLRQALRRQGGLRQGARHGHARRRLVARHGRGQPPRRAADHAADRRRAAPAAGDDAARLRSADRPHHLRRRPDGDGLCHHLGGAGVGRAGMQTGRAAEPWRWHNLRKSHN